MLAPLAAKFLNGIFLQWPQEEGINADLHRSRDFFSQFRYKKSCTNGKFFFCHT